MPDAHRVRGGMTAVDRFSESSDSEDWNAAFTVCWFECNSISVQMFVSTVLPSRSGALAPDLQKHKAPTWPSPLLASDAVVIKHGNTWLIRFAERWFLWDIKLSLQLFHLPFVHSEAQTKHSDSAGNTAAVSLSMAAVYIRHKIQNSFNSDIMLSLVILFFFLPTVSINLFFFSFLYVCSLKSEWIPSCKAVASVSPSDCSSMVGFGQKKMRSHL